MGYGLPRQTVAALTELVFENSKILGSDLETFAKHAKRTTIQPDDVKLCARRSPHLLEHLSKIVEDAKNDQKNKKTKKDKIN